MLIAFQAHQRRVGRLARLARLASTLWIAAVLSGCALLPRAATVPMRIVLEPASCATRPDTLLVVLPGAYSVPEEFVREGFVAAVRERQLALDVWLPDAHLGYYRNRTILERLLADVVAPARAQGYRHIWLLGISLGGFGALALAQSPGVDVDGIVVLAPYLGEPRVIEAVAAEGGLRQWRAPDITADLSGDPDFAVWRWLKGYAQSPSQRPPLLLGYGLDDRLARNAALLGAALPPDHVLTLPGGHDWPAWTPLWRQALARMPLPVDRSCQTRSSVSSAR